MELFPPELVLPSQFNPYRCVELNRYWFPIALNIVRHYYIMAILLILNIVTDPG